MKERKNSLARPDRLVFVNKKRWILLGVFIAFCSAVGAIVIPPLFSNDIMTTTTINGNDASLFFEQRLYGSTAWSSHPLTIKPNNSEILYQVRILNNQSYSINCYFQMIVTCSKGFTVVPDNVQDFWGLEVDYGNDTGGVGVMLLHSPELINWTVNETGVLIFTSLNKTTIQPGITPDDGDKNIIVDIHFNPDASGTYTFKIKALPA